MQHVHSRILVRTFAKIFASTFAGIIVATAVSAFALPAVAQSGSAPETLQFKSLDGAVLTAYLFRPAHGSGRTPAIVMMHGRAGAYSSLARGRYDASTLSKRHAFWGQYWAAQGYAALLVDGFGPRGYPAGFPIHSYNSRPDEVSEVTVRPRDAYGALNYLRSRPDIDGSRIALQGWSNGGSSTIAAMSDEVLAANGLRAHEGFRGGVAFYPACGLQSVFDKRYLPYAPLRVFSGDADEEVSAKRCAGLVNASRAIGGNVAIDIFPGATHGFDDPGMKRQSNPANVSATEISAPTAAAFIRMVFAAPSAASR